MINVGILLDVCGIVYSETQLLKLETLVNDFIKNLLEKKSSNIDHSISYDEPAKEEFFDESIRKNNLMPSLTTTQLVRWNDK